MSAVPAVGLVRRWAVDWLNGQHPEVCETVLAPGYGLHIGGFWLGPREEYVPATMVQLSRFPGLVLTTHQLVTDGERVAVSFSEHGASARLAGRAAVWTGVSLFRSDGTALTACFAEEDYYGRRRQFDTGRPDPVLPPAVAPWDAVAEPPDPAAESAVREWLGRPDLRAVPVVCDDEHTGQPAQRLLEVSGCEVHELFSAGAWVAFHAVQSGSYLGGLDDLDDAIGTATTLELAGLVQVVEGRVVAGRVVRDRLGTSRSLRQSADAS
ncbi:MAG: hypothetical protein NVSMB13_18270 [Mycobacteriales bacterium]